MNNNGIIQYNYKVIETYFGKYLLTDKNPRL